MDSAYVPTKRTEVNGLGQQDTRAAPTEEAPTAPTVETQAPSEPVEQNGNHKNRPGMDRHPWNTNRTRGNNTGNCQTCEGNATGRSITREAT